MTDGLSDGAVHGVEHFRPHPRSRERETSMATEIWSLSKRQANYRASSDPQLSCARCRFMFPPLAVGGCRLIRGIIRGGAVCDRFVPRGRP
jgi:hypothetical protein